MVNEYKTHVGWKEYRSNKYNTANQNNQPYTDTKSISDKSPLIKKNPTGRNDQQLQCYICCLTAHFARNCPHKPSSNYNNMRYSPNEAYVATLNPAVIECDISNIKVLHKSNHMILDTVCPQNVAGKVWFDYFIGTFDTKFLTQIKQYSSKRKFKLGGGRVLKSLFYVEIPILLAGENV